MDKTFKIDFKADLSSLQEVQKILSQIQKDKTIKLDTKGKDLFGLLTTELNAFVSLAQKKMSPEGIMSGEDFLGLSKQFNELLKLVDKFKQVLITTSVSPQFKKDIENTVKELDKANAALEEQKKILNKRSYTFDEQGQASAKKSVKNAVSSNIATELDLRQLDSNAPLRSFDAIRSAVERINEELADSGAKVEDLDPKKQNILQAWDQITKKIETLNNEQTEANKQVAEFNAKVEELEAKLKGLNINAISGSNVSSGVKATQETVANLSAELKNNLNTNIGQLNQREKATIKTTTQLNQETNKTNTTFGKAVKNVVSYGTALKIVRSIYNRFISTITELDKELTNMTVVTSLSRDQAWKMVGTMQDLGKATGQTTTEIAGMVTMYLQQGKTLQEATTLTEAAAKAARIAGISGKESINLLTNAMNGFQLSADKAMEVSDKFAALAASAATNYEELATALSKVASQANLAGMSMDFTLGLLTKGIETTREAPETIGTALKTVISRMRELTDYGATLEDSIDVNRVDKALKNIGVALLDENREFRNLDDVLSEVGEKWDTLNKNQQANVAVALAGTRQQSRLIAMMQDFDRTQQLVNISMSSAGTTAAQHRKYMQGLEATVTQLTTAFQALITSLTNSDIVIGFLKGVTDTLQFFADNTTATVIVLGSLATVLGLVTVARIKDTAATIANTLAQEQKNAAAQEEQAVEALSLKQQLAAIAVSILRKLGLQEVAKALGLEAIALNINTKETTKNAVVSVGDALAKKVEATATTEAAVAQHGLNAAISANPIGAIIALFVILAVAIIKVAKETGMLESLVNSFKGVLNSIINVIKSVFQIVMDVVDLVLRIFQPLIQKWILRIQMAAFALKFVIDLINILVKAIRWLVHSIYKIVDSLDIFGDSFKVLQSLLDWFSKSWDQVMKKVDRAFADVDEKVKQSAESIKEAQDKIYDNKQKINTLEPLIEEYEKLSAKVNKSVEDLERLQAIEQEIADSDENNEYTINGQVKNIESVKTFVEKKKIENKEATKQNLNELKRAQADAASAILPKMQEKAREALQDETFKDALSDSMWDAVSEGIEEGIKDGTITAAQSARVQKAIQSIASNVNINERTNLDAYVQNVGDAILQIEKMSAKGMSQQISNFNNILDNIQNAEIRNALKAQYSGLTYISNLGLTDTDYANLEKVGIGASKIGELRQAYVDAGGAEQDFTKNFADWVKSNPNATVEDLTYSFMQLGKGLDESKITKFTTSLTGALQNTQGITESAAKAISKYEEAQKLQEQYFAGELSGDAFRAAIEKSELFSRDAYETEEEYQEFLKSFYDGTFNANKKIQEVFSNEIKDLTVAAQGLYGQLSMSFGKDSPWFNFDFRNATAETIREVIEYLKTSTLETDEQKKQILNTLDQIDKNRLITQSLQDQALLGSTIYQDARKRTELDDALLLTQSKIAEIQDDISESSEFNLQQHKALVEVLEEEKDIASKLLKTDQFKELTDKGFVQVLNDGTLKTDQKRLEALQSYDQELFDWFNENFSELDKASKQVAKDAKEIRKEYKTIFDGIRNQFKEQLNQEKEFLDKRKEMYSDYWDEIDALEEEEERVQKRESLLKQIAALAGGSDSASNARRKELLQSLEELNKESLDAQKQAQRDAWQKNIDKHTEHIDEILSNLDDLEIDINIDEDFQTNINRFVEAASALVDGTLKLNEGTKVNYDGWNNYIPLTNTTTTQSTAVSDYSGAIAQGQSAVTEAQKLNTNVGNSIINNSSVNYNDTINIDNIVIQTQELNTNQDFRAAGAIVATAIKEQLRRSGKQLNVKQ